MDPLDDDEDAWCGERRAEVAQYLHDHSLDHGQIGEVPAWFVAPLISVWTIESLKSPGWVGWWAVCGDLPTDYCSAESCRHPSLAVKRIAERWNEEISATGPDDSEIGSTGLLVALLPLLQARTKLLLDIRDDDAAWPD